MIGVIPGFLLRVTTLRGLFPGIITLENNEAETTRGSDEEGKNKEETTTRGDTQQWQLIMTTGERGEGARDETTNNALGSRAAPGGGVRRRNRERPTPTSHLTEEHIYHIYIYLEYLTNRHNPFVVPPLLLISPRSARRF